MTKTDGPAPPRPKRPTPSPQRVAAFATGISAESKACAWLIAKGYRILARRFRTPHGEIDVVARHRHGLVFVEVKARGALDDAAYAVTPRQRARIIAADVYGRRAPIPTVTASPDQNRFLKDVAGCIDEVAEESELITLE